MQKHKMERKKLSELEACVLGVIWRGGPNTAYQVRMAFAQSLTTSWRASTGAIYPLIRKLKARELIKERAIPNDPRNARILEITKKGLVEVQAWVADGSDWVADPAADTIRTRYYFLSSLPEDQRRSVVSAWIAASQEKVSRLAAEIERYTDIGDKVEAMAHRGAMMQLQARVKWLNSIDDSLIVVEG